MHWVNTVIYYKFFNVEFAVEISVSFMFSILKWGEQNVIALG